MKFNKLREISQKFFKISFVSLFLISFSLANVALGTGPSLTNQEGFETNGKIQTAFNPNGGTNATIGQVVGNIINIALGFLGIIFVVILILAGFKYFTAQGNTTKTGEAIASIKTAIIGLIIILMAYAITTFVMNNAINVTSA